MAYHTRRSGPQGMGRGTPPPMMYQQQRNNNRPSPNFGGNRNTNSSNNYQGNQSQSQSNNANYAQQHQTQQPHHPIQKPGQQQQVPVKQEKRSNEEQMQSSLSALPPPPPPPTLMDSNDTLDTVAKKEESEENGVSRPKPWMKVKVPGFKVNKRLKRRRQNARLRKILQPKNAIMVLNELKTGIKFTFQQHTNALTQTMFVVNAEVEGKTYVGQGLSKPLAKQNAAENALKDLLLQKMADAAVKVMTDDTPDPMNTDTSSVAGDNDSVDGTSESGKAEDEVPWGSLASFALYKLFTEWQNQGTHVPISKAISGSPNLVSPVKQTAPAPMKKIPDNPTERHPVMLLNQLKPGVEFHEVNREGLPPNVVFTISVTIDGATYSAVAKNKKDAKKEAAKAALAGSFNIKYD